MKIPSIAEQDTAIAECREFCQVTADLQNSGPYTIPPGWNSAPMLLLKYGKPFYFDGASMKGRRMRIKECYKNAWIMADAHADLTYCEGKLHIGPLPIDHAWVVDPTGKVIEPTLRNRSKASRVSPQGYFGIPFHTNYVRRVALRSGMYGGLLDGMINPEIIEGRDRPEEFLALPHLDGETRAVNPPKKFPHLTLDSVEKKAHIFS